MDGDYQDCARLHRACLLSEVPLCSRSGLRLAHHGPRGIPLSLDACLIKANDSDPVYLSTNGVKSHIKSVEDFNKVGFDWDKIKVMSPAEVDAIPTAPEYEIANW